VLRVDGTGRYEGVSRVCGVYGLVAEVNNSDVSVQTREQLSVIYHSASTCYQEVSDFHSGLERFFTHRGLQNVYDPALKVRYSKWQINEYIRIFVRIQCVKWKGCTCVKLFLYSCLPIIEYSKRFGPRTSDVVYVRVIGA
jgi:hypothetical protein